MKQERKEKNKGRKNKEKKKKNKNKGRKKKRMTLTKRGTSRMGKNGESDILCLIYDANMIMRITISSLQLARVDNPCAGVLSPCGVSFLLKFSSGRPGRSKGRGQCRGRSKFP